MYKQSPNRHHRSKGIKVKHILQICVLVAVCFWLLYQVKHSRDKRKEFESKDDKVVGKLQIVSELQRIGRKDIPRVMEITTNAEKHEDNDDDEKEDEDKENKHKEDETEKEDTRVGEREDERGGGDDDIDEHEPEKTEEDEVDEDKKREEKGSVIENEENEDTHEEGRPEEEEEEESGKEVHTESEESDDANKDDHGEREITSEDHDRDLERNTRKAQEELYKADDASSEVTHNVQSVSQENENVTLGQANQIYGTINFGQDQETKTSENVDKSVKPELQPREDVNSTAISSNKQQQQPNLNVNNSTASNATTTEQNDDKAILTMADDSSFQNSTLLEIRNNSTVGGGSIAVSFLSNGTQKALNDNLSQNGTVGANQSSDEKNHQETSESANKPVNVNTNDTLASSNAANDNEAVKDAKDSLVGDGSEGNKPEDTAKAGTDGDSALHSSEGKEAIQDTLTDASSTAILAQKERKSRIDLDTLPEIKNEVHDTDAMAE